MSENKQGYYVPTPSIWPIVGSLALLSLAIGATLLFNDLKGGLPMLGIGFAILVYMLFGWFGTVIRESESGRYNRQVDTSFRWSMSWFIFSEVMFFSAFFGALFYARVISVPMLATQKLLWPNFVASWPSSGPYLTNAFRPMQAWGIPAINTLILLTSGATLTWAHWGLVKNNRVQLKLGLLVTVLLGLSFVTLQAHEYLHAAFSLSTGVYGCTFFMLTGFHGLHVMLGTTMLIVMLVRSLKGHFTPEHHFAFEAAAWYWHFVDVVWLLLFIFVYWL
ncbi:MAG TPA: cytochrome c oxidase subunit 3 [Burkholderiales bacterium]|nr:cytochrome c oxidase subunit 3 [Pseudomonadota bacterium]HVC49616.1 cytochrome c oxidase subunit 3 [Burkholderiales bacterium]